MGTPNTDLQQYATANQEAATCTPAEPIAEATEQTATVEPTTDKAEA